MWRGLAVALWASGMAAACFPTHSGRPLRDDCGARKPKEGAACTGTDQRYCAYKAEDGEDVCYCQQEQWVCYHVPKGAPPIVGPSASASASAAPTASASAPPPPPPPAPEPEPEAKACPDDMVLVDKVHCTKVRRKCKRDTRGGPNHLIICHEFEEGSTQCVGKKRRQRFCIDRYEYPSEEGGHPPVMVSAYDAAGLCAEKGKRMCFESEWTAACEGPDDLPFPYGWKRSKDHCNIDNLYVHPDLSKAESKNEDVRTPELTRLDQSVPSGSMETCKSGFGVYDLTGNFDEWVRTERIRGKSKWAGLKGGAWGIVRNACRPITTSHVAHWSYYFISFRCCQDPNEEALDPPPDDGIPLWKPPDEPAPEHPAHKPLDRGWVPSPKP
jgi:hypothetical protein